jgi:hypothetical protein
MAWLSKEIEFKRSLRKERTTIHFRGQVTTPCGIKVVPFLRRTGVPREVNCAECLKCICPSCDGTGLYLAKPFNYEIKDGKVVNFSPNKCATCRGSGLKNW